MKFETVLFDLDGTLTDPYLGITNSIIYALKKFGIEENDRSSLRPFIGPPLVWAFSEYYGFSESDSKLALNYYREYFSEKGIFENVIYDGIPELLKKLKNGGTRISLATSKPEVYAVKILDYFDISKYFDYIAGNTFEETRSDKDAVIAYALDSFKIGANKKTAMVGDRRYDVEGGSKFGLFSVAAAYGYGKNEEFVLADSIAHSVRELYDILV